MDIEQLKKSLQERKVLIENTIQQHTSQINSLSGHLNETIFWLAEVNKSEGEQVPVEDAPVEQPASEEEVAA